MLLSFGECNIGDYKEIEAVTRTIDRIYRESGSKILATLIRILGDIDRAEDALQEALRLATEKWILTGVPDNPVSWLVSVGKFRAIDALRRSKKVKNGLDADEVPSLLPDFEKAFDETIQDDLLRLVFMCCHPRLSFESQIALTLREVCGLSTNEIASAFLVEVPTVAQRLVRAKATLRRFRQEWFLPEGEELNVRLSAVLHVIYLIFNEGYFASTTRSIIRKELVDEAIRLGRLILTMSQQADVLGLLGLMILQKARLPSRIGANGEIAILDDQDRTLWDRRLIFEGCGFVRAAMNTGPIGKFTLQAAIIAVHSNSPSIDQTDWKLILELYERLLVVASSPVVELNLCIALAMVHGPEIALSRLEPLLCEGGSLVNFAPGHLTRGELALRSGNRSLAQKEWELSLHLAGEGNLRDVILRKLASLDTKKKS